MKILVVVLAVLCLQDQAGVDNFLAFCKKPNAESADNAKAWIRRGLDQQYKDSSLWYSLYLVAALAGEKGQFVPGDALKKLADHVTLTAAEKPDGEKHLAFADTLAGEKSEILRLVAMGHLDDAIKGKANADKIDAVAKKLGLEKNDGAWATPAWITLIKMKTMGANDPVGVGMNADYAKDDSVSVRYFRAVCLLRGLSKNMGLQRDLEKVLNQLKSDPFAKDHCEAIKKQIDVYTDCTICKKVRDQTCGGCGGKGQREIVCLWCKGTGISETKVVNGVTTTYGCPT